MASSTPAKLRVVYQLTATALPALVAEDEGYFAANGLDVTLTPASGLISAQIDALGHQFDVAMATQPDLLSAVSQHIPVVAIPGGAVDSKAEPAWLLMAQKSITSLGELSGKTIASPSLSGNIQVATENLLAKQGVTGVHYVAVAVPLELDQLKAGQVAAMEAIQPFANEAVKEGYTSLGDPFDSVSPIARTLIWVASSSWADGHQNQVEEWQKSFTEAVHYIQTNLAGAQAIEAKYLKLPLAVIKLYMPTFSPTLDVNELTDWVAAMKTVGRLGPSATVTGSQLVPNWWPGT